MICPLIVEDLSTPGQMLIEVTFHSFLDFQINPYYQIAKYLSCPSVSDPLSRTRFLSGDSRYNPKFWLEYTEGFHGSSRG